MSLLGWLFGSSTKERTIEDVYDEIGRFNNDDDLQNEKFIELAKNDKNLLQVWKLMKKGGALDSVPNASGAFGHDFTNPIPVNGIFGEITYLSRLLTSSGEKMFFHRLGSINAIDVFELVSQNGSEWDVLYVDLYHTRKTRLVPNHYQFQTDRKHRPLTSLTRGIDGYVEDFPRSFYYILFNTYNPDPQTMMATLMISDPDGQRITGFNRPVWHSQIVAQCLSHLSAQKVVRIAGNQIITTYRTRRR